MPMRIYVNDVAVRDGFQIERSFIPTDVKVGLIDQLSRTGLHKIEVTSFVSPKAVPALADADDVLARIGAIIPVTPVPLACAAVQSFDADFISHEQLIERMAAMRDVLQESNGRVVRADRDIEVTFEATCNGDSDRDTFIMGLKIPATSLCPCSKEISAYGAHNQRCEMEVRVQFHGGTYMWIEELFDLVEKCASAPVYAVLKRPDEKYVTERAYENPKFAEDLVRDVALELNREPLVRAYVVEAENFESIHNHSAFARLARAPDTGT